MSGGRWDGCEPVGALLRDDAWAKFRVKPCNRRCRETGYLDLAIMMQMHNSGLEAASRYSTSNFKWVGAVNVATDSLVRLGYA